MRWGYTWGVFCVLLPASLFYKEITHEPLTRYEVAHVPEIPGTFWTPPMCHWFQRDRGLSWLIPACITSRAWPLSVKKPMDGKEIDLLHKAHHAPVPYPTIHHSEQKCVHFCSECCIVGPVGYIQLWDLWIKSIGYPVSCCTHKLSSRASPESGLALSLSL